MVQKQNLIHLNWKPTQKVVEPYFIFGMKPKMQHVS